MSELIILGRVTSVYGIKGWVNVYSYTDPIANILDYKDWYLHSRFEGDKPPKQVDANQCRKVKVTEGRVQGKRLVAEVNQCHNRDDAKQFTQHDIYVLRNQLPELEDDVYWADLEGLDVINLQDQKLGVVDHVIATGANDVLVVKPVTSNASQNVDKKADKKENLMIPYVQDHYVIELDIDAGWIKVDWQADYMD